MFWHYWRVGVLLFGVGFAVGSAVAHYFTA